MLYEGPSLASHPLHRERKAATIEMSPQQKLDVTNQIHALHRCRGVQLRHNVFSGVSILVPNCYVR